jgi:hypothetical protein
MSDFTSDASLSSVPDLSKRVRYSTGLVLGVDEFEQDQAYFIERDRLLSRALHGYGVVQGLGVEVTAPASERPQVTVQPGLAMVPSGQHVCVEQTQCAVLEDWLSQQPSSTVFPSRESESGGESPPADVEPKEVCLSVVLRYGTCETDFVPIPGEPCRSAEDSRAPSRLADDFSLALEFHQDRPPQIEEHATRLLGRLLRALEVRPNGPYVLNGGPDLTRLITALPEALSAVDDPAKATLSELETASGVTIPTDERGGPVLPVEPGQETAVLRAVEVAWVRDTRRRLLRMGHDPNVDPLGSGRGADGYCQPVPKGDDGIVLGTFCLFVEPMESPEANGTSGLKPAPQALDDEGNLDAAALKVSQEERPRLLASRVLQETGLFDRVRPGSEDGEDESLIGKDAGGDLDGTYPDPEVVGLRREGVSMTPANENLSLTGGQVLTYDGSTWRPAPPPQPDVPPPETVPSNAETNLTRIVALSWEHEELYEDPGESLALDLEGVDGEPAPALGVAFGPGPDRPTAGTTLTTPQGGVLSTTLTPETVRMYLEWRDPQFSNLSQRMRIQPRTVLPLRKVQIGPEQRVRGGTVDTQGGLVRGVAILFPEELGVDAEALSVDIEIRGDLILDDREKAIDAEFARGELPTGDRARGGRPGQSGVQGGRFESWLYLRGRPGFVEEAPFPEIEVVDLNAAGPEALVKLPGIGETIAERIIAFREEREEAITDPYQLTGVSGLTENQIEQWEGLVKPPLESSG